VDRNGKAPELIPVIDGDDVIYVAPPEDAIISSKNTAFYLELS